MVEGLGDAVGAEAQFAHGLFDAFAQDLVDGVVAVEDAGDGGDGDLGALGNVVDGWGFFADGVPPLRNRLLKCMFQMYHK
ncbi:hypothetical protein GCM10010842_20530 [Deinococcus daejeonensis]|uniref:Uncharacterized protein n=1 Tax=Deinococcus daejeonensis TaxID=1007098 RepID=A0ABQ2J5X4_9DEIO|nr:hypothetical protein GCM10010842_20530 [Deinococcus daejeonensis]